MLPKGGLEFVSEKSFDYSGPVAQCLRQEAGAAMDAAGTASKTGAALGQTAAGELGQVQPFYARNLHAEHEFDPTQMNEMLTAAGLGSGAQSGQLESAMERQGAVTGNAAGQTKGLQEGFRDRLKSQDAFSQNVASQDVLGAKQLQQEGAAGMSGLYGENLKGQLDAMGQVSGDINAATQANQTGWLQQAEGIAKTGAGIAAGH